MTKCFKASCSKKSWSHVIATKGSSRYYKESWWTRVNMLHKKDAYEIKVGLNEIQDKLSNWRVIIKKAKQCDETISKVKIDQIWRLEQDCK